MNCFNFKILIYLMVAILSSCEKDDADEINYIPEEEVKIVQIEVKTDKAAYAPGEQVVFFVDKVSANMTIKYKYLNVVISQEPLTGSSWEWSPPSNDFRGYMAELYQMVDGEEIAVGSVAIDVSSDWKKFPRYGFLSKFGQISATDRQNVISKLNRYHINGLQFYDWHYKAHLPLAMDNGVPKDVWKDIINRDIYFSTVEDYISLAHQNNMKTMFYNLAYGTLKEYADSGIEESWFLYSDANHSDKNRHNLPQPPFVSDIYLTNPSGQFWIEYLNRQNSLVYENLEFDGFHIDQLGNRGQIYDYEGNLVDLRSGFSNFISAMKDANPEKRLIMNAVDQYAQENIAAQEVDFLYSEVWSPNTFEELANVISENHEYSNGEKNTVLAAYMNYDLANNTGHFNRPGILLADAVIFAFGGAHLELGEHMLGKEYFPNANLAMSQALEKDLMNYYDFLVGYQNLLRDGGDFNQPEVTTGDGKFNFSNWPPQSSRVSVVGKHTGNKQVLHLLNFSEANSLNWRDTNGTQVTPSTKENFRINVTFSGDVSKIWFASPDFQGGASQELTYSLQGTKLNILVPSLKYWSMLVIESN